MLLQQSHQSGVVEIQVALAGMESDSRYPVPLRWRSAYASGCSATTSAIH
jgi:hypothetical protein